MAKPGDIILGIGMKDGRSAQAYFGQARAKWLNRKEAEKMFPSANPKPQPKEQPTMKKYLCHYIVEAGPVLGARSEGGQFVITVDLGEGCHETVKVDESVLDYDSPETGDYLLRGIKGQIQVMSVSEFKESHAQLFDISPQAKNFEQTVRPKPDWG